MSKRQFEVVGFEGGQKVKVKFSVSRLFDKKEEQELFYTLQEVIDNVLDLKVGEALFIDLNRDNREDKGVILRTK